jgi:hypothetical protein
MRNTCLYKDAINFTFSFPVPGTLFMQTRASSLPQHHQCDPSQANGWKCDGSVFQMSSDKAKEDYYFADIERFTLLIDHAYRARVPGSGKLQFGKASEFDGCVHTGARCVPIPHKPDSSSEYPSVF